VKLAYTSDVARPLGQEQGQCKTKSYNTSCAACSGHNIPPPHASGDLYTYFPDSGFLPANSCLCPSVLDLGPGMGQTDGQRPSIHCVPSLWGRGIIMKNSLT